MRYSAERHAGLVGTAVTRFAGICRIDVTARGFRGWDFAVKNESISIARLTPGPRDVHASLLGRTARELV